MKFKQIRKAVVFFIIAAIAVIFSVSWRGLAIPSGTTDRVHESFRGKSNVLQVSPAGSYGWAVLTFDLSPYAGRRVEVGISMDVWLDSPGAVVWQINNSSWPVIAGGFSDLAAGQWHSVRGSSTLAVQGGNVLFLSAPQFKNAVAYFADLSITVNGEVVNIEREIVIDTSLPALHTKWPFKVGVAVPNEALSQSNPQNRLLRHFNVVVAENVMKPNEIMPNPWTPTGAYRWTNADRLVSYAAANNTQVRGHVLVWHEQTPEAFFRGSGTGGRATIDELYARMENHIKIVFEKYGGRISWWDVCNEVVGDNGAPRANSLFTQIMNDAGKRGMDRYEYVLKAFQWARQYADANGGRAVKLYLTEYGIETSGAKLNEFLRLLDYLIANNAPIDGVGIQGHIRFDSPSVRDLSRSIDSITAKQRGGNNLVVQVCELDISLFRGNEGSKRTLTDRELNTRLPLQTARYRELFDMFEQKYNEGKLEMVLIWGVADGHSWLNYFPIQRTDYPLLFDRSYSPKPAYNELIRGR